MKANTRASYSLALRKFLDFVYGGGDYEVLSHRYLGEAKSEQRDCMTDLSNFRKSIEGMAPTSRGTYITVVGRWLEINHIELDLVLLKRYRGNRQVRTRDKALTQEQIEKLGKYLNYRDRLITLIGSSSGMRTGEIVGKRAIRARDVDFNTNPVTITIPAEISKTSTQRITFLDGETGKQLQEYIEDSRIEPEQIIFGIDYNSFAHNFRNACKKAGLTEKDVNSGRNKIHPYSLRKGFATGWTGDVEVRELLMGHSLGVKGAYKKPEDQELAEKFLKNWESKLDETKRKVLEEIKSEAEKTYKQKLEEAEARHKVEMEGISNELYEYMEKELMNLAGDVVRKSEKDSKSGLVSGEQRKDSG